MCRNLLYISLNYYYELEAQVGDLHLLLSLQVLTADWARECLEELEAQVGDLHLLLGLQVGHHQLQDHILLCCRNSLYDNDSCNSSVVCLVMYTIYAHL